MCAGAKTDFFCCCSLRGKEEKSHPARRATQNQDREALLALPFRRMELVFRLGTSFRVPIWMNHGYSWVSEHWWFLVRYTHTHTHTKRRVISLPKKGGEHIVGHTAVDREKKRENMEQVSTQEGLSHQPTVTTARATYWSVVQIVPNKPRPPSEYR